MRKPKDFLQEGERLDDLHRNGYHLIQNPDWFCFGIDAVLLSSFAKVKPGERVLDIGCGSGVIPILLAGKTKGQYFLGIELQEEYVELANRSILLNELEGLVEVLQQDLRSNSLPPSSFDVVVSNPPYIEVGHGLVNPLERKAFARHEFTCTLMDVFSSAARVLKTGGRFYIVHKPSRLADIVEVARQTGLEPKTLRFVHSRRQQEPCLLLLECIRGGKPFMRVLPPLVIYHGNGEYTEEIKTMYYGSEVET